LALHNSLKKTLLQFQIPTDAFRKIHTISMAQILCLDICDHLWVKGPHEICNENLVIGIIG